MTYFECLTQLQLYIKKVLENCEEKNWEELSKNEKQRQYFNQQLTLLTPDNSPQTIELIKETLALNKKASEVALKNKKESENNLLKSKRNLKNTALYK